MTPAEMVTQLKRDLNRPDDDERYDPDELYAALTDGERAFRRRVAAAEPELLAETVGPIASTDGGETYPLAAKPLPGLRVYTPPGPRGGVEIEPSWFGGPFGYVLEDANSGATLHLTMKRSYTPGLYVRMATTAATINAATPSSLPEYMHRGIVREAGLLLATKPGARLGLDKFQGLADREWQEVLAQIRLTRPPTTPGTSHLPWYQRIPTVR